jgi:hypothetical protein
VIQRLISTARDAGPPGRDRGYGFGIVDPVAALAAKVAEVPSNPLDTTPPPGKAAFGQAPAHDPTPQDSGRALIPSSTPATNYQARGAESLSVGGSSLGLAAVLGVFALLVGAVLTVLRRL